MKIYTRTGDEGETGLFGGPRVRKDAQRVEAYGAVDELNAVLGSAVAALAETGLRAMLIEVQSTLFDLGGELATPTVRERVAAGQLAPQVPVESIERLERWIDELEEDLEPLTQFILPGGAPAAASLHHARTVCRRAERRAVTLAASEEVSGEALRYLKPAVGFPVRGGAQRQSPRRRRGASLDGPVTRGGVARGARLRRGGRGLAAHRRGLPQQFRGLVPADAGVGDGHAVAQLARVVAERLLALEQVALDHQADHTHVAGVALRKHVAERDRLERVVLVRVGVAAIDEHLARQPGALEAIVDGVHVVSGVVRPVGAAAQHHVAVRVPVRQHRARAAVAVDAQKRVRLTRGQHGVDGDLDVALGAVLEADRHREPARHLAVRLALRRAGADGRPRDEVGEVLRG